MPAIQRDFGFGIRKVGSRSVGPAQLRRERPPTQPARRAFAWPGAAIFNLAWCRRDLHGQQQLLAKGWGYALLNNTGSVQARQWRWD